MDFKKYMGLLEEMMDSAAENARGSEKEMLEEQKEVFSELKKADGIVKGKFDITDEGIVTSSSYQAK